MKNLLVFGAGTLAEMTAELIAEQGKYRPSAYVVDDEYFSGDCLAGVPVITVSELKVKGLSIASMCVLPLGFTKINQMRRARLQLMRALGYEVTSFVHDSSVIWAGFRPKPNTLLYERVVLQPFVELGENVTLRAGSNIGHHSVVGDDCFIASGVVTGGNVVIGTGCFIGLGSTIRDGVTIGDNCFIAAGSVVVSDTEAGYVYMGSPAKKTNKKSTEVT